MIPAIRVIGGREMSERAVALQARMEVDTAAEVDDLRAMNADAVHSGIDGHVVLAHSAERRGSLTIGPGELGRVHRRHDVILEQSVDGALRGLTQQQDG